MILNWDILCKLIQLSLLQAQGKRMKSQSHKRNDNNNNNNNTITNHLESTQKTSIRGIYTYEFVGLKRKYWKKPVYIFQVLRLVLKTSRYLEYWLFCGNSLDRFCAADINMDLKLVCGVQIIFDSGPQALSQPVRSLSRCVCLLASGGTIWLLLVYKDPDGIKIDSVGTNRRKCRAVGSDVVFLTRFIENNVMALLDVYPIEWCIFFRKYTHKYMEHGVNFDVFERAQNLKRMTRDQNRVDFLTNMQLAATFQHMALFSILKFVNVHKN